MTEQKQTTLVPALVEGELRILDTDLAMRLGFCFPANIRKLIGRHELDLARMGVLATVAKTSNRGGRPSLEYYLNRRQAIFITTKSETSEATDISIEIIEKFDAYERDAAPVVHPAVALNDPETLRRLLLTNVEQVIALKADNAQLTPKANALDRIATANGSLNITEAAKALQIRPAELFAYLSGHGWIYRRPGGKAWLGYQTRTNLGDLEHKVTTILRPDGSEKITEQVLITPRGLAKLAKLLARPVMNAEQRL